MEDKKISAPLTFLEIWQDSLDTLSNIRKPALIIVLLFLILPQTLSEILLAQKSLGVVDTLRRLHTTTPMGSGSPVITVLAPALEFAETSLPVLATVTLIMATGVLSLAVGAAAYKRGDSYRNTLNLLKKGLFKLPSGVVALFATSLTLAFASQIWVMAGLIFSVLGLMVPTLLATEAKGGFSATYRSLSLKYARPNGQSGWPAFFQMTSIGSLAFAGVIGASLLREYVGTLSETLSMPHYHLFIAGVTLEAVISSMTFILLTVMTNSLYFKTASPRLSTLA